MKKIILPILCIFLLSSCEKGFFKKDQKIRASEEFAQGSEDIPLLVGMTKLSNESMGFDTDAGSIMTSSYTTKNDLEEVHVFYLKTLPQMGWKVMRDEKKKVVFRREKEKLEIEFFTQKGKNVVKFFLSSAL